MRRPVPDPNAERPALDDAEAVATFARFKRLVGRIAKVPAGSAVAEVEPKAPSGKPKPQPR